MRTNPIDELRKEMIQVAERIWQIDERIRLHSIDTSSDAWKILNSNRCAAQPVRLSADEIVRLQREREQLNARYWTAVRAYHKSRFGRSHDWIDKSYWDAQSIAASQRAAFSPAVERFLKRDEDEKQASEDSGVPLDTL